MNALGHNERSYRLDALAAEARRGLDNVEKGEDFTLGGWLAYGHALNEGRALFPGDKEFGEWVDANALRQVVGADGSRREVHDPERTAAMWAAANADQFEQARQRGNPRTLRGIHAKWKELEAERAQAQRDAERQQRLNADQQARAEAVEAARTETEVKTEAELQARHLVEVARDEAEQARAIARAEATAQEAFKAIERAEAAKSQAQAAGQEGDRAEPEPDPQAAARKALRKLTRDALEEEVLGLHAALAEEKTRRKTAETERDEFKAKFKEATSESDLGRSLGLALRQRDTAKGRLGEELVKNARQGRRIAILEAEIKKLQRSLELQEIPLR